jgi:hypothetical protein
MSAYTLTKVPVTYSPTLHKDGKYVDDVDKYKWSDFEACGIICPCNKSRTIHRNKNSFKHAHCKTKKHMEYTELMNNSITEENVSGVKEMLLLKREMKELKIQVGRNHASYLLEVERNKTLQGYIRDITFERDEIKSELKQNKEFLADTNAEMVLLIKKNEKYDKITREMMVVSGYELES